MSRESGLQCVLTRPGSRHRADFGGLLDSGYAAGREETSDGLTILIRVPRVEVADRSRRGPLPAKRRRRRLRREVRAIGLGLMAFLPVAWMLAGAVGGRVDLSSPSSVDAGVWTPGSPDSMPVVLLSLEPVPADSNPGSLPEGPPVQFAAAARDGDNAPPTATIGAGDAVQRPGYLIPADGSSAEVLPHAGY